MSINHFTHPSHSLVPTNYGCQQFICNGCNTYGSGTGYRCNRCNFDLHDYCGKCPPTLNFSKHPGHVLTLVPKPKNGQRCCDVCNKPICGLCYQCTCCGYDVHPCCTKVPCHPKPPPKPRCGCGCGGYANHCLRRNQGRRC